MGPSMPEYNVNNHNYSQRDHLHFLGPILDVHAHVMRTQPGDPPNAAPLPPGPLSSTDQAALMLDVAQEFGITQTVTMCSADDITPLRERFGDRLLFNGLIGKKSIDEPDDAAYRTLDRYLELGVKMIKFWSAPRGRDRGMFVDAPWRIEAARRAIRAGVNIIMVHVADPDAWFKTVYADSAKFGTKPDQYVGLEKMLTLFPEATWIGAHMGGDIEHPDHLEALLEKYPNLLLDTSATKWQVREVPPRREAVRSLICRHPDRFLFGVDLVTRHGLDREHYVSRYWCQRTLWESGWHGPSPIADPDATGQPMLHGVDLPMDVLRKVYFENTQRLIG